MQDWSYKPARDLDLSPAERLKSLKRETGLGGSLIHSTWSALLRTYLRTYHRLEIHGREHLPQQPPFIFVCNHVSHLDALVLACALPPYLRWCTFPVAAGDVFFESKALSAFAAYCMNALPLWRKNCGRHAMDQLRARLTGDPPCGYILFPEGRRSPDGTLLEFKPGIGMLVAGTDAIVVPAYLQGAHEALARGSKLPRPKKMRLFIGAPFNFKDTPNTRVGWERISAALEGAVRELGGISPKEQE